MPAAKKLDDYIKLANGRGFEWIGPLVTNTSTKTGWKCPRGHYWEATYNKIYIGRGCPECAGSKPKVPEDYRLLGLERGFSWAGPFVSNTKIKTFWGCQKGHKWEAAFHTILGGSGCPFCNLVTRQMRAVSRRHSSDDYFSLAQSNDFKWLGPDVTNAKEDTWWECSRGHKWKTYFNNIQQGRGCPTCGWENRAEKRRKDMVEYVKLAKLKGFKWLGPSVKSALSDTWWECSRGHKWKARYNTIQQGFGCRLCATKIAVERQKKKVPDYLLLAERRGFGWNGPEVEGADEKTWWTCGNGHKWEARYHDINGGSGCPVCVNIINGAKTSKIQEQLCERLGGKLNEHFKRYKVDVYLNRSGTPIAVEYDSWYWHAGREIYDDKKTSELIEHGWKVLRIKSNALLPEQKRLDKAIDLLVRGEPYIEIQLGDWGKGSVVDFGKSEEK